MEHLTKQQIILLTLFTTFVTSIATGIVTVSLVDQAPAGVTGTVERVIEQTVNQVASGGGSTDSTDANSAAAANAATSAGADGAGISSNPLEAVASATAIAQKSLVRIELDSVDSDDSKVTGLGVVVSKSGLIITDKSTVAVLGGTYTALFPDGKSLPVVILQSQNNGDMVFLLAQATTTESFTPATFVASTGPDAPILGEVVVAISGSDTTAISQGIIRKINADASSTPLSYVTDIDPSQTDVGSPLFDLSGHLIGIQTLSLPADAFYPVSILQAVIPVIPAGK